MTRSYPPELGGEPRHDYRFEGHVEGTAAPFLPIISGSFDGASASRGSGSVALDFEALWTLGMNDAGTPHGLMQIAYDRASDPATVDLTLDQDGFGVVHFGYGSAGYRDGRGGFDYAFRTAAGDLLTVATGFDAVGGGRAQVSVLTALGATGSYRQCWDSGACLVYVDDPANFSCATPPCSAGEVAACPTVPTPPF